MKKLIAIILPVVLFASSALAQERTPKTPEERATMQTKHMVKDLSLNSEQEKKVMDINLSAAKSMDEVRSANSGDRESMKIEAKKISSDKDAALKAVLDEKQYNQYLALKQARMDKMKSENKNQKGNKPTEGKRDSL